MKSNYLLVISLSKSLSIHIVMKYYVPTTAFTMRFNSMNLVTVLLNKHAETKKMHLFLCIYAMLPPKCSRSDPQELFLNYTCELKAIVFTMETNRPAAIAQ